MTNADHKLLSRMVFSGGKQAFAGEQGGLGKLRHAQTGHGRWQKAHCVTELKALQVYLAN